MVEGVQGKVGQRFDVELTDEAFYAFASVPSDRVFAKLENDLTLLERTPFLGRIYDPAYEAMLPPFQCRVLYCEHYGIYYQVDEQRRSVVVFAIVDQRRNPSERFACFEYGVVGMPEDEQGT